MKVTSSAFQAGQAIPAKYTCEGADISPPLEWSDVPAVAKSLALICDDPDAPVGTWVHWVLYDLPVTAIDLAEKVPPCYQAPDFSDAMRLHKFINLISKASALGTKQTVDFWPAV